MVEFRKLSYDAVRVGEEFTSDDFLIKPEDVETFAFAVDDHHPWYFEDSPFGGTIAPPVLLGNQVLRMRMSKYIVPSGGLNAKMQIELVQPIRPGMRVRSRGKVIDKYEKRGRHFMVTEFITEDESGTVVTRGQFTQMIYPD